MAINMYVGYKKANGSVSAIYARVDGGEDQKKLFYKYYRTPERVNALIKSGSTRSALGIYISKKEECNMNSPLYNKEVTMLPLYVGSVSGNNPTIVSFAENEFYDDKYCSGDVYDYDSVEKFYADAEEVGFFEHYVYLFDSNTREWTVGYNGMPLKDAIIEHFDKYSRNEYTSEEEFQSDRKILIENIESIDRFVKDRDNEKLCFVDSSTGDYINISDSTLLMKYQDLFMYAKSIGLDIEGCMISNGLEKTGQKNSR